MCLHILYLIICLCVREKESYRKTNVGIECISYVCFFYNKSTYIQNLHTYTCKNIYTHIKVCISSYRHICDCYKYGIHVCYVIVIDMCIF